MKAGAKYEQFIYAKLKRLFPDAVVKLNDKIPGSISKFDREIDVSIRMSIAETELLYIVQCKDWASPVDINTLGAFSAVMQDVGAAKGFLLCTSGFYKTNHQYALGRGIELVTIEDIESDKWTVQTQIPFVYIRKICNFMMTLDIVANEALVELNRDRELAIDLAMTTLLRSSASASETTLEAHILQRVKDPDLNAREGVSIDLTHPGFEVRIADIWVPCSHLSVVLHSKKIHYMKYVTPTEYSQLRDHVRGITLPLHVKVEGVGPLFDSSFSEMPEGSFVGFPGLWFQVEESNVIPEGVSADSARR